MRIAVTGAAGFIGHELVSRLIDDDHEVIMVDFVPGLIRKYENGRFPILQDLYRCLSRCQYVADPLAFVEQFPHFGAQVVVHLGAVVDTTDLGSDDLFFRNVTYTEMLVEACNRHAANLIFASSAAVYGSEGWPNNPYGLTKAIGEKFVSRTKARSISLRFFNVFGRNEDHKGAMASVPWKIAQALNPRKPVGFKLHSLDAKRDFVPSSSVVKAIIKCINEIMGPGEKWHRTYDVGTGMPTSFRQLTGMIEAVVGSQYRKCIQETEMPRELVGRYQPYTRAGEHGVPNIGDMIGTEQGIREAYGVDK